MIEWFSFAQIAVAVLAGIVCLVAGLAGRTPADLTLGLTLLVEVLLIVQLVVSLVAPAVGNVATGSVLEFFVYLVSAVLVPPLAALWALVERTRWSTVILGIASLAVAVMLYRMNTIWFIQTA
ncbi:MAG: hypothetical protein H7248_02455 [Microbacteriaceae bacterium]|nr:hypothetical protein [Microbacteriaceae bacterium]